MARPSNFGTLRPALHAKGKIQKHNESFLPSPLRIPCTVVAYILLLCYTRCGLLQTRAEQSWGRVSFTWLTWLSSAAVGTVAARMPFHPLSAATGLVPKRTCLLCVTHELGCTLHIASYRKACPLQTLGFTNDIGHCCVLAVIAGAAIIICCLIKNTLKRAPTSSGALQAYRWSGKCCLQLNGHALLPLVGTL